MKRSPVGYSCALGVLLLAQVAAATTVNPTCKGELSGNTKGFVGIADGYGSGGELAGAIRARGYSPVSILSTADILECYRHSYLPTSYVREFRTEVSVAALLEQLARLPLTASIAGSEPGVQLNDQVTEHFGLASNGVTLSKARRHKSETQKVLRAKGLNAIREKFTGSLDEALSFIDDTQEGLSGNYPVVVKPDSSAGTEGFTLCHSRRDVEKAFRMVGTRNKFKEKMERLLVQEFLRPADFQGIPGGEYVINTVSRGGKHVVVEGFRYHKKAVKKRGGGESLNYDWDELIDVADPRYTALVEYALKVIEALGIQVGPAHLEIMITERGPVLIEMGARLMGGAVHRVTMQALGTSALDLTVDAYLDPEAFDRVAARGHTPFSRKKHVALVQFLAPTSGFRLASPLTEELEKMRERGLFEYRITKPVGRWMWRTIDLGTSPGLAILMADDEESLTQLRAEIRVLESRGLFRVTWSPLRALWNYWKDQRTQER